MDGILPQPTAVGRNARQVEAGRLEPVEVGAIQLAPTLPLGPVLGEFIGDRSHLARDRLNTMHLQGRGHESSR
jgi:hypothetical protein